MFEEQLRKNSATFTTNIMGYYEATSSKTRIKAFYNGNLQSLGRYVGYGYFPGSAIEWRAVSNNEYGPTPEQQQYVRALIRKGKRL